MRFHVRIKQVDHDGFNGRDHFPSDNMVGDLVCVEKIFYENYEDDPELGYHVIEGFLADGTQVTLIDHEVFLSDNGTIRLYADDEEIEVLS